MSGLRPAGSGPAGPVIGRAPVVPGASRRRNASGWTDWACFAGRRQFVAPVECVEWVSVPAGAVLGERRRTRTEHVDVVVAGHGEALLDGAAGPVRPGSAVLGGVGSAHVLRCTGDEPLQLLTLATLTPATGAALAGRHVEHGGAPVHNARIVDLYDAGTVDTSDTFGGPLHELGHRRLGSGECTDIGAPDAETVLFVVEGGLDGRAGDEPVTLGPGSCLALPAGAAGRLTATGDTTWITALLRLPEAVR